MARLHQLAGLLRAARNVRLTIIFFRQFHSIKSAMLTPFDAALNCDGPSVSLHIL